jgi:hypothetical protein
MNYYFVAKNKTGGFVGQRTLESITKQFHSGEIPGNYIVTESYGPSYAEIIKLEVPWITVAELIHNPPVQNERFASNQIFDHSSENKSSQNVANAPVLPGGTKRAQSLSNRYWDAYLVARATVGMGAVIKVVGILLGILICSGGFFIATTLSATLSNSGAVIFISVLTIVGGFGVFVGALLFLQGILISAQGQTLKASLDSAVNNSPFLSNDQKAKIMSLPTD